MTRFVLTPDVALRLAREGTAPAEGHRLVAPAAIRSQLVSRLYRDSLAGGVTRAEARRLLDHVRSLDLRLLGDRVSQARAWDVAAELGWDDTVDAEYVALVQLQADALVTLDPALARAASALVAVASYEDLGAS